MKVRSSIKRLCKNCTLIIRRKRKYIYCSKFFKHKQKQKNK